MGNLKKSRNRLSQMAVESKFSWERLKDVVSKGEIDSLGRLPEDLKHYSDANARLKAEFEAVDDHILHRVFGFPCELHPTSQKKLVRRDKLKVIQNEPTLHRT
jgi:hypothetical protein